MTQHSLAVPLNTFMQRLDEISHVIHSKDLYLDHELKATLKNSTTNWMILLIFRPFFTIIGRDLYLHTRVDCVIKKLEVFFMENSAYILPEKTHLIRRLDQKMVDRINKTIIDPLNVRTRQKYQASLEGVFKPFIELDQKYHRLEVQQKQREEEYKALQKAYEAERVAREKAFQAAKARAESHIPKYNTPYESFFNDNYFRWTFGNAFHDTPQYRPQRPAPRPQAQSTTPPPPRVNAQRDLEQIFGCSISDDLSLRSAFRKWSRKNHPDKVPFEQRDAATKEYARVNALVVLLKAEKGWN